MPNGPNANCLFDVALEQAGHFTTRQAERCGVGRRLLSQGSRQGRYRRVHRGVYRLRDYPWSDHEELMAAWLAVGKETAVVSHESALDLFDLSDVIPAALDFTVPRSRRNLPRLPGVRIHTTTRPRGPEDIVIRHGFRITSPARTIADAAQIGVGPEQIEMAVRQVLRRPLATCEDLEHALTDRCARVRRLVTDSIARASPA